MKLTKKQMLLVSVTLFSLFFGAGNLIFPPFLGQLAGASMPLAMLGFLVTAVILPVMGVVVVAKFDGLEKLGAKVNSLFAFVFTLAIYLSIGPGLGIPRAASVPFEMAISPLLPEAVSPALCMLIYSSVFFAAACWIALTPNKIVDRLGRYMSPCLLLIVVVFVAFLFNGTVAVAPARGAYADGALVKGFLEGYNTMDAIAALNFGLVIATAFNALRVSDKKEMLGYTVKAGIAAGLILAVIYFMLSFMGMLSSAVYELRGNGAWTLRCIVAQLFGGPGSFLLAVIFTLACLTTCVGLITSISQYLTTLTSRLTYRQWAYIISLFSFAVCNQGLNTILSVSVPVLNAVYPIAIVLIVLGLTDSFFGDNRYLFPMTIGAVTIESLVFSIDQLSLPLGIVKTIFEQLPFYGIGMGWFSIAVAMAVLSVVCNMVRGKKAVQA